MYFGNCIVFNLRTVCVVLCVIENEFFKVCVCLCVVCICVGVYVCDRSISSVSNLKVARLKLESREVET